jgi:hypothetical protein
VGLAEALPPSSPSLELAAKAPVSAIRQLIAAGIVTAEEVVEVGVIARNRSRSNLVFLIEIGGTIRCIVKGGTDREDAEGASPRREEAAYRWAQRLAVAGWLPPMPRVLGRAGHLLILEAIGGSETLAGNGSTTPPGELLAAAGRLAAVWHRASISVNGDAPLLELQPVRPWVLRLFSDNPPPFLAGHPALASLFANLADPDRVEGVVARARDTWAATAAIHGDLRWDNYLLAPDRGGLVLIDWEFSGWGDPAWDLSSLLADALSIAVVSEQHPEGDAPPAERACQQAVASIAGTVSGYVQGYGTGAPQVVDRLPGLLPARLLLLASQQATWGGGEGRAHARRLVAVAAELAREPAPLLAALGAAESA